MTRQARARRTRIIVRIVLIVLYIAAITAAFIVGRWYVAVVLVPFLIWSAVVLCRALRVRVR